MFRTILSAHRPILMGKANAKQSNPIEYSALFLLPGEGLKLLSHVQVPVGWKTYAHHATIEFAPKAGRYPTGDFPLEVSQIRQTPEVMFALVSPPPAILKWTQDHQLGVIPWHVTLATAPGVKPVQARLATEQGVGSLIKAFDPPLVLATQAGGFDVEKQDAIFR